MNKELSFENTKRLLKRKSLVEDRLMQMMYDDTCRSIRDATSQVNKAVYEMAEKQGCSIWDICFSFVPEYSTGNVNFYVDGTDNVFTAENSIKLVPLKLEFEHGPGYWKSKYFQLKKKIQSVLDEEGDKNQRKDED